jgi:hypothetical protein
MKTELGSLIGIVMVFIATMLNLFFVVRNAKKATFTGSVTASRIKYIQDIREAISKFCGLAYYYNNNTGGGKLLSEEASAIRKEADSLKYLIRLYLNPEDKFWDTKIMLFCDEVIKNTDKGIDELHSATENLVVITQYLLKLEWQGIKEEAKSGVLSERQKKLLYDSYVTLYKNHVAGGK